MAAESFDAIFLDTPKPSRENLDWYHKEAMEVTLALDLTLDLTLRPSLNCLLTAFGDAGG